MTRLDTVYPSLEQAECPYDFFEAARREAPVYEVPGREEWVISRHADVEFVLRHPEIFSSQAPVVRALGRGRPAMTATDPPQHKARRVLATPPFSPARIRGYEPMVREVANDLVDRFVDSGTVDLVAELSNPLPAIVTTRIMGLPPEDYDFIREFGQLEGPGQTYLPGARQRVLSATAAKMVDYMTEQLTARYEHRTDDALSELVTRQIERDGELDLDYLVPEASTLLSGGVVTSAHMIANTMLLLLRHPREFARVRADFSLIPTMLEESLRLESPVQWQPRYTKADVNIGGTLIPAQSLVLVAFASANRDDAKFESPEEYDVTRANVKRHVAFGQGVHFCIGAPLARLEGKVAFETLFTRFKEIRLAEGRNDFAHLETTMFRGLQTLHVEVEPV